MKKLIAAVSAIALIVASARAEDLRTIDGQVFVRTQGAETIKLSLVDIQLFDGKPMTEEVERKRKAAEPIYEALLPYFSEAKKLETETQEAWMRQTGDVKAEEVWTKAFKASFKLRGMTEYTHSAVYYFSQLPKPLQTTKTDADGKFTFKVPSGSYVLAAASSRKAGNNTEFYNWMIHVTVDADKKVMLANDNLSTSGSPDSMISTVEINGYVINTMEGESLALLETFLETKKEEQRQSEARRQKELREQELAEYRQNPKAAQQKAVALYPAVAVAGTPLNNEFVARLKHYRAERKEFFADPDWPIRLAKECADELAAKLPAK